MPTTKTGDAQERTWSTEELVDALVEREREEGRREGWLESRREGIGVVFAERFGALPPDVAAIVARTDDLMVLRRWLKLVARASMEEALASIRGSSDR